MSYINQWHDVLRIVVLALSVWCAVMLIVRKRQNAELWNAKTLDYWYALLMWSIAGIAIMLQGIILDRPFTPAVVVVTAAVLVTCKGLYRKGSWGGAS